MPLLHLHGDVLERFPGLRVSVAWAKNVNNRTPRGEIDEALASAWRAAAEGVAGYGNPQSHPRIVPWRERMRQVGVSPRDFPSSVEALVRRAAKGGEPPRINPLVDFYNAVSLEHLVPAGGFDTAATGGPILLRVTRGGERFAGLGTGQVERLRAGEVTYAVEDWILTRHFVWRQSAVGAITPETTEVLLLAEVLGELGESVADEVVVSLSRGLESWFDVEARAAVLSAHRPSLDLEDHG
jgi:DNA/RNA-binding domain of Phe-tRNA-synthetase-like protein